MHIPLDNAKYSTGLETSWDQAPDAILNNISSTCCVWGAKIPACAFLWHGMKGDPVFSASVYIRRPVLFSSGVSASARNWEVDTQTKKLGKTCPFSETEDRSLSIGLGCGGLCLLHSLPSSCQTWPSTLGITNPVKDEVVELRDSVVVSSM